MDTSPLRERRRALLLVNRRARRGGYSLDGATAVLRQGGVELLEVPMPPRDQLTAAIREHAPTVDLVIVGGGDGTINASAKGILETGLPLGILPLGTANDLARTLALPLDPAAAASVIVAGRLRDIDVGEANDVPFFNVASIGFSAELARRLTGESKRRWGKLGYAIVAARLLRRMQPFHAHLRHDDCDEEVQTLQVAVGSGRFYGGGLAVAEGAAPDDGRLDVYSLETSHWLQLLALLPGLKRGTHVRSRKVRAFRTTELSLHTRRPRDIDADGELMTRTPARFRVRPAAVKVFAPPPE